MHHTKTPYLPLGQVRRNHRLQRCGVKQALLFPVRHFTEAMQRIVSFGGGVGDCGPMLLVLCLFPLVSLLVLPRLKSVLMNRRYDTLE